MLLLLIFAFIAGAATAISPCALPVLPIVLSAGTTGGRRRPLGIATGLAASFTFSVVALVYVVSALGLPDQLLRTVAIIVLAAFGVSMMLPKASEAVEGFLSKLSAPLATRINARNQAKADASGFGSGFVVGSGLGLVYAPCAGPILAGVITVTASQEFSAERLFIAAAYGLGSVTTFYAIMLGGRRLAARLIKRSAFTQTAMGATMVAVAMFMFAGWDLKFQQNLADKFPSFISNPTGGLERAAVKDRPIAGGISGISNESGSTSNETTSEPEVEKDPSVTDFPVAPEIVPGGKAFNTANGQSITLKDLRGKVVLVDFWTYTCINCIRTIPYLRQWWNKYKDDGLVIIGVHAPEFPFERSAGNVAKAISDQKITYPVIQDNEFATWKAYKNQFWPAKYLIDANGKIRYQHFGEGEYSTTESKIQELLAENGKEVSKRSDSKPNDLGLASSSGRVSTPETYLGSQRADRFANSRDGLMVDGTQIFRDPFSKSNLPLNAFSLSGRWQVSPESVAAEGRSKLKLRYGAKDVFLVLRSPKTKGTVSVYLNGKPVSKSAQGRDVKNATVQVNTQRLYHLVSSDRRGPQLLELIMSKGVEAYAFTFG